MSSYREVTFPSNKACLGLALENQKTARRNLSLSGDSVERWWLKATSPGARSYHSPTWRCDLLREASMRPLHLVTRITRYTLMELSRGGWAHQHPLILWQPTLVPVLEHRSSSCAEVHHIRFNLLLVPSKRLNSCLASLTHSSPTIGH